MEYTTNQQSPTQKASILPLLRVVAGDTNLASGLSQVWVLWKSQLGEELTRYGFRENLENELQLSPTSLLQAFGMVSHLWTQTMSDRAIVQYPLY
nr:hypothetical protein [Aulosira sp. ZfuVER01]